MDLRPEIHGKVGFLMFLLVENGLAEEYANIEVLDWQLRNKGAGVVKHGRRGEQFDLSIFFGGHLCDLFL